VYTLGASTNLTVSDNTVLPANANLSYTSITVNNQGKLTLGSGTTLAATSITVSGGGTFNVGGGSTVTVSGQVLVTGNSNIVLQSTNNTAQVTGTWQGGGATMNAASVQVDPGSSINADGQGYVVSAGPGGAAGGSSAGGSYGGLGGIGSGSAVPAATYGSPTAPTDPGSGGGTRCCGAAGGAGGGAMRLIVTGTLTNNGIISSNGGAVVGFQAGGGSGGSVLILVSTLAGSGSISANGGAGGEAGGGGGRVAVYYVTNSGFNPNLIVAGAGANGNLGSAGTVTFSNTPLFLWVAPTSSVLYGTENLVWMAGAVDPANTTVNVIASGPQILTVGAALNANSNLNWDTTTVPDGRYELRLVFHDVNGNDIKELPRTVVINNSVAWHVGTITSNQEWTANQVQGLSGTVVIPSGVTVTIDPGTIVKALPGSQIIVQSGGILNALGGSSNPVIFTAFDDSSVGGDSDFSGGQSVATPGEWNGISAQVGGQFNSNSNTEILYVEATQTGTLPASEAWPGDQLFLVTGIVTVPGGATLTIQPGAVVKFGPNAGITVQPGGQLIALGTVAQPIYFTSINDNTVGSVAAGSSGTPMPGDWASIIINGGVASFNHVQMLYGGGPQNSQNLLGMIETGNNAVVTISNSILGQTFWDGLLTGYVNNSGIGGDTVTLTNSVVYGVEDRGVEAWPGSTVNVTNDTLDGNNNGIQSHGGTITVANTIVSNSLGTTWGGIDNCGAGIVTVSYSDVWNSTSGVPNYVCMTDPTGTNGNISVNPVYVDNAAGNYRLNYGSPAIDAASGTVPNYPLTDAMGDPRYNDPLVTNKTGVPDVNGNYPDMGAFEFVQTAASDIDLTVPSVTGPATAVSGNQVQLTWTDTNTGSGTAQGPWHDAIYLVQDPDTNPILLLAGEVLVAGGVTLGPGQSYTATGTVRVPGTTVGNHRWEVVANDRGEVFVGQNSVNDKGISLNTVAVDLPQISVDSAALNNSFTATGQSWWYKIDPAANQSVSVNLTLSRNTGTTSPGSVQLFIGEGYVPTPQHYDFQQVEWNSPTASIVIPNTSNQTYYVTAYAQTLASAPTAFTISASTVQFSLTSVQPASVSDFGSQILTFQGGGFTSGATYELVGNNNAIYTASSVFITDSTHAQVTFTMAGIQGGAYVPTGVPNGTYTAEVIENGTTASLSNSVTVSTIPLGEVGGFFGTFQINVQAPQEFRTGFPAEVTLNYQNITGYDQPAPVIWISATGANLSELPPACSGCNTNFPLMYQSVSTSGLVLGIENEGPAGVLPAGAQGSIKFLATPTGGSVTFTTQAIDPSIPDPLIGYKYVAVIPGCDAGPSCSFALESIGLFGDATALCSAYLPPGSNAAGFSRTCMQFLVNTGYGYGPCAFNDLTQSCGGLDGDAVNNVLAADATALSKTGIYEYDTNRLMSFEWQNDGLDVFNRRYHQGAFGFGQSHAFDITATITGLSGVAITYPDGTTRTFAIPNPAQSNQFLGVPGDYGVLTVNADTTWTLSEKNGMVYHFKPGAGPLNQVLDYIQDLNGNRVTLTYTNGLVSSAVDAVGNTISFVYDSLGHVTQTTDPVGRVTTYTYDIKSDSLHSTFLTSITDSTGTTGFAWNEGGPSGVGYFGNSCVTTYCEPAIGVNTITYPDGTHTYFNYDALGRIISQYRDGPTETLTYNYGPAGTMSTTDADGNVSQLIPNQYGAAAQAIDPLGSVTLLAYDPEQKLTQIEGPMGTSTSIGYDSQDNVALLLDPLGYQQSLSSTSYNNLQSFTDGSGNATGFTYDSRYNLTGTAAPDGSTAQFTYDGFGNVTSWTNRRGHTINFAYNSKNLLTTKTYTNGSNVIYTYDGHDNLQTVSDSTGTTTFTYDSADRGTGVFYPNGKSIQYFYNAGGQRTSMVDSTGFTVQYAYDPAGRLSQLTNASNALIVSYTYDAAGRPTKKTRGNGTYTTYTYDANENPLHLVNYAAGGGVISEFDYTYDALGRQVTMNAPSGPWAYGYDADNEITNVTLPGGAAAYTYDAGGNRLTGSGISYNVNNLDQYTSAGANAYQYDADGNLISGGGWTYTYDDENRLVGMVSSADSWSYQYNGIGNRISATHNGTVTQYLNDPSGFGNVEAEFTGAGALVSHYTYGLDLTSAVPASGSAAYYHFDAAGNTAQMTDASGNVVNSYTYLPFGEKLASTAGVSNPFTYVGEYGVMDEGSGLYFMRNCWYSPALGRFIQQDPIGLDGGSNLYAYTGNGPNNDVDPEGTEPPIGTQGNTNAVIEGTQGGNDILNEAFPGWQTAKQTNQKIETNTQGAKAQAAETVIAIVAPAVGAEFELEVFENPAANYATNKILNKALDKVQEKGLEHVGLGKPESIPAPSWTDHLKQLKDMAHFFSGGLLFNDQPQNSTTVPTAQSKDPNGKLTSGFGDQGFVPPNTPIIYTIYFENQPTATAPAEEVVVSDPLPSNLDWSTVQLSQIQFNNVTINVPAGLQAYVGQVSVSTDPNPVSVNAALNTDTGVLSWTVQSVDPTTGGLPANPLAGFLPPNNSSNLGTGYVTFGVKPKSGLANGATISNQGLIVFDANSSISTNTVTNTIDTVYPTSSVNTLPATTTAASFPVSWSGTDSGGSGIANYDIYVSVSSGAYTLWLPATTLTSGTYPGAAGQTYSFYSMATDNIGLRQQATGAVQTITVSQVSSKTTPTVTVSPASSSITMTQALSVTVAVNGGSGNPVATGSLTLTSGAYTSAAAALSNGSATIIVLAGALALGSNALTANYTPDSNSSSTYNSASGTSSNVTVAKATPTVTVTPSLSSITTAQALSVTIAVSSTPTPTGMVTLSSGSYTSAATALSAGGATISIPAGSLAVGGETLTASYTPDSSSASTYNSASGTTSVTVTAPARTTPTVTVTPSSSSINEAQSLTVTVVVNGGTGNPTSTETVTLSSGSYTSAATTLTSGSATITIPAGSLAVGGDTLTVNYTGDTNYNPASGTTVVTVSALAPTITFTVPNHTYGDAAFTLTATSNSPGAIAYSVVSGPATVSGSTMTLTGAGTVVSQASQVAAGSYVAGTQTATFAVATESQTITFVAPASPVNFGAAPISLSATSTSGLTVTFSVLSGPASISGSTLTITGAGTVVAAADQSGNANYAAATEVTRSITVNKGAPAAGLTASPNPILVQNTVTLTATVASSVGTPTGSVVFSDSGTTLGTANLAGGIATLSVSTLGVGSHSITAVYGGDGNFNSVSSAAVSETVQDFTLTAGGSGSSQTVHPGGTATYTLPMSPSGGTTFPAAVTLSATGLPTGFTATFSPPSLAAGSSATSVVLTIQVPLTARLENRRQPGCGLPLVALGMLILPFLGGVRHSRKWLRRLALIVILLAGAGGVTMLTGCGGGSSGSGSQPNTYNITVTATSGALSHSTNVTLTVQ
jgi:RHS repeat-associated protein